MKFAPFKSCTLPKHVRVEILHREFPVKNLYFPCKGLQCSLRFALEVIPKDEENIRKSMQRASFSNKLSAKG